MELKRKTLQHKDVKKLKEKEDKKNEEEIQTEP